MAILSKTFGLLALAILSNVVIAVPEPVVTDHLPPHCFSYTTTVPGTGIVNCPLIPATCPPHPDCVRLTVTTLDVPPTNKRCPITPTVTVTGPPLCPTCQTGCATETSTETVTITPTARI